MVVMDRLVTSNNGTPDVFCRAEQKVKTNLGKGSVLTQCWTFKSDSLVMHTYFSVLPKVKYCIRVAMSPPAIPLVASLLTNNLKCGRILSYFF